MKPIVISFSLVDQSAQAILKQLEILKKSIDEDHIMLIHGNLPREEVLKRNLPTELVDGLQTLFPLQLNLWKDGHALRPEMADCAKALRAEVFIIGRKDTAHVSEEIKLYEKNNLNIHYISLE